MDLQSSGPLVLLLVLVNFISISKANIHTLANSMKLTYNVINNNPDASYYAELKIKNIGAQPINGDGWSLFFCHKGLLEFERFDNVTGFNNNTHRGGMTLSHISGCMYKLTPGPTFGSIGINSMRRIVFIASHELVTKWDVFPNYYLADDKGNYAVINNTEDDLKRDFVEKFDNYFQYTTNPLFESPLPFPPTPLDRFTFTSNDSFTLEPALSDLIPTPKMKTESPNKQIYLSKQTKIRIQEAHHNTEKGKALKNYFKEELNYINNQPANALPTSVNLRLTPTVTHGDEWYELETKENGEINLLGKTNHGLFNAFQTLLNLMHYQKNPTTGVEWVWVPIVKIKDEPRYEHRGIYLDVASNFVQPQTIKKLLKAMALLKLNKLHLLLANDYGVRLEIEGLPKLTEVGAHRCHDETEKKCLFSDLGSHPSGKSSGSGYYTIETYVDILRTAKKYYVEVVPVWNFDNNMRASEMSMRQSLRKDMDWSLPELDQESRFKQNFHKLGKVDPCAKQTYKFLEKIIQTIKEYHRNASSPLKTFSIGGEHNVDMETWYSKCKRRKVALKKDNPYVELKVEFTKRLSNISRTNEVGLHTFENVFNAFPTECKPTNSKPCPDYFTPFDLTRKERYDPDFKDRLSITIRDPNAMFLTKKSITRRPAVDERDLETKFRTFQKHGYKIILSLPDFMDFNKKEDMGPYVPGERGFLQPPLDLRKVFGLVPDAVCCSKYVCYFPPYDAMQRGAQNCLQDPKSPKPLGIQARITTEKVYNEEYLFQLAFPRLIAFAERAWHAADWELTVDRQQMPTQSMADKEEYDFGRVKGIISRKTFPNLERIGINYYIPPPGIEVLENYKIRWNTEYLDHIAQIQLPNSKHFYDIESNKVYNVPYFFVRTRTPSGMVYSRAEKVTVGREDRYEADLEDIVKEVRTKNEPIAYFPIQTSTYRPYTSADGINGVKINPIFPVRYDNETGRFFNNAGYKAVQYYREKYNTLVKRRPALIGAIKNITGGERMLKESVPLLELIDTNDHVASKIEKRPQILLVLFHNSQLVSFMLRNKIFATQLMASDDLIDLVSLVPAFSVTLQIPNIMTQLDRNKKLLNSLKQNPVMLHFMSQFPRFAVELMMNVKLANNPILWSYIISSPMRDEIGKNPQLARKIADDPRLLPRSTPQRLPQTAQNQATNQG